MREIMIQRKLLWCIMLIDYEYYYEFELGNLFRDCL